MNKIVSSIAISFCLFGCGPTQEELEAERKAQYQADLAIVTTHCQNLGFKPKTSNFSLCLQQSYATLINQRQMEAAARQQAMMNGFRAMQEAGQAMTGNLSSGSRGPINTTNSIGGTTLNCRPQPFPGQMHCW